jgi:6,7-dimethyl-8-ribityllumazine synthase
MAEPIKERRRGVNMPKEFGGMLSSKGFRFAIVVARWNDIITSKLLGGAMDALIRTGANDEQIAVVRVPGSYEIPATAKKVAKTGKYDAIICLGCVIRGATPHFEYIAGEASKGIAQVGLEIEIPVTFGVVTTDNLEQALERAGSKAGNKGWEAAMAAVEMVNVFKALEE